MTAEEWKKVDEALASVWSPCVHLKIDGYKVSLNLTQKSRFQNAILVYVNDELRGKWLAEDCEIRRRFYCCKSGQLSPKRISKNIKSVVKKQNKSLKISLVTMYIHHTGQTLSQ